MNNTTDMIKTPGFQSTTDSEIVSNEHYEFLQLNQVGRLSPRAAKGVDTDEQSLRQFNAELLQRIGEYRKRNLELSAVENELRSQLASQLKQSTDRERELTAKYEDEIETLRISLADTKLASEEAKEDWSRRLAKLSDESWAQALENETLKRSEDELSRQLAHLQETVDAQSVRHIESEETHRSRETQMTTAFEALRIEYSNIDKCYAESNAALVKLQSEMRSRETKYETEIQELTSYLKRKGDDDASLIREENARLRESLAVRDTRHDVERASLTSWKDQLSGLDQHLKQFAEKLQRSKTELTRLSKSAEEEIKFSLKNPFTDYLDMAELEVQQIQAHLAATSTLSPLKQKLEVRLQQAVSHRDGIGEILDRSDSQLAEHARSIQTLIKSLEFLI